MASTDDALQSLVDEAEISIGDEATITEISDFCGYSRGLARQTLDEAGLTSNARREWPTAAAVRALMRHKDPGRALGKSLIGHGDKNARAAMGLDDDDSGAPKKGSLSELAQAKAEEARLRAEAQRVKIEKLRGDLISRSGVMTAATDFASLTRNAILALPLKLAARLEGKSRAEIVAILDEETHALCQELADSAATIIENAI